MASVVQFYEDFMSEHSDPRVENWTFMDTPLPTLFIVLVYLATVLVLLPTYMKNRKPFQLTLIIRYYNIFQIVACSLIIYKIANAGWITGEYSFGCQPVDYSDNPKAVSVAMAFFWYYLLKLAELSETIFFVLRKKFNQVSGLHLYHHASTLCLAWIGCKFLAGGMVSVPIMLNSFIHVIMYAYYYLSSFGPEWQKKLAPWKPKLTIMQMIQFTILITHSLSALQPTCKIPKLMLLLYVPNILLVYKMFYDFYQNSYQKRKSV
ncbi:elongation of very long chain fatty acids protein AAEL008004-like [Anoplophora glabripennis]|uniref:elongation of very long chain fatty acids protein AAEL008004-like n=1 Tax=Anoplophora glabripennis TaxID=217634 RepID=UPI0008757DE5|nr:elongation of very long chain fatty acids protein AAEL008004-like [Anoplophora glabripennis]